MKVFTNFIKDFNSFSIGWRLWMILLQLANLVVPLFFWQEIEAQVVLSGYFIAATMLMPLYQGLGWVRILGVVHFSWFVIVPWLLFRYLESSPSSTFGAWLLAVILINGICLIIDIVDVRRYLAGDRKPVVKSWG